MSDAMVSRELAARTAEKVYRVGDVLKEMADFDGGSAFCEGARRAARAIRALPPAVSTSCSLEDTDRLNSARAREIINAICTSMGQPYPSSERPEYLLVRALAAARAEGKAEAASGLRVIAIGSHGTEPHRTPFVEVSAESWQHVFGAPAEMKPCRS